MILLQCPIVICCLKNHDAAGDSPTNIREVCGGRICFLFEGAVGVQTTNGDNLDMVAISFVSLFDVCKGARSER